MCKTGWSQKQNNTFQRIFLRLSERIELKNNCLVRRVWWRIWQWTQKTKPRYHTPPLTKQRKCLISGHFVNLSFTFTHYNLSLYPHTELWWQSSWKHDEKSLYYLKAFFTGAEQLLTACIYSVIRASDHMMAAKEILQPNLKYRSRFWCSVRPVMWCNDQLYKVTLNLRQKFHLVWKMNKIQFGSNRAINTSINRTQIFFIIYFFSDISLIFVFVLWNTKYFTPSGL